jgi:uncharacterized iron-regulated membrane protein
MVGPDGRPPVLSHGCDRSDRYVPAANHEMALSASGEWGGLTVRVIYGAAGFAAALLMVTGFLLWWLPKRAKGAARLRGGEPARENVAAVNRI